VLDIDAASKMIVKMSFQMIGEDLSARAPSGVEKNVELSGFLLR
jgi:hypothetical protein